MSVRKRSGELEPVDLNKIVRAVERCANGLSYVSPMNIALKTISGLYDGASTKELDNLSIQNAADMLIDEPEYGRLAARLLSSVIDKEVGEHGVYSFSQAVETAHSLDLANDRLVTFVRRHQRKLNDAIDVTRTDLFEYFGLRTVYDRYLLRHPTLRTIIETPQHFWMRVACALSEKIGDALELYAALSRLEYIPSSPTLFNAGTRHEQLSSCFLLDSPQDDLAAIYDSYKQVALLSKYAGGIGIAYSRVRSSGSLIKGTNGLSNGIVPWLKTLDASVAAVHQGGKRKGACAIYLETWHADIEAFLELRDNTGEESRRTHNLNLANWIPDLFMRRVEADEPWSLFDPKEVPSFPDLYGEAFEKAYVTAEEAGLAKKQIPARQLYRRMMRTLAETGNGWMCFKDTANAKCNQVGTGHYVHLSNLCVEILEVNDSEESSVCNLASIVLSRHMTDGTFDYEMLARTVRRAVVQLDRVIDLNYYPTPQTKKSNNRWRPVGLGVMGLQDVFFMLKLPFDSPEALELSTRIQEHIYFAALSTSCELAEKKGHHAAWAETRAAQGVLQFDLWGVTPTLESWPALRARIAEHGLRNSLLIAPAPTATIASIAGCFECIEPQVSNLFKRETMSGDFLQVNKYLVQTLKNVGQWNEVARATLKKDGGSARGLVLAEYEKRLFRTSWELPQKALIDLAAARGPYVDQSQSLNLFMESPTIDRLSSMYMYAWKKGLKTTYYLRSRPATEITQVTIPTAPAVDARTPEQVACSLESPESCESCQ